MSPPLRILHVEDNVVDAELVQGTLAMEGIACDVTRVETEPAFFAALQRGGFDLILADYTLPSFDGLSALRMARQQRPDLTFIFVSGTLGEEVAIEALKIGATDYVLKTRLSRLVPSVQRALREATERADLRRSEDALRRSETYLAIAQSLSHTGSFGWDSSGGEIFWSLETFRIFELDPTTKPTLEFILQRVHPEDRVLLKETLDRILLDRTDFHLEHRLLMLDGRVKYLRVLGRAAHDPCSSTDFVGAVTDITAAKQAERELHQREAEIRRLVEANIVGIFIWDLEGRIVEANDAFLRLVGYDRHDLTAGRMRWADLTPPEWLDLDQRRWGPELKATGSVQPYEEEYFRKDGSRVPVLIGAATFEENGNHQGVAFVLDLTERKRAEQERERLRQLQADLAHVNRVSMLGELAASLSHELKQPIAAAITNANTCLRWLQRDQPDIEEASEAVTRIVGDGNRAAEIIHRLRSFYKQGAPADREPVDVNELVREMLVLMRSEANRYSIPMLTDLAADLPRVTADRVQLQQVFLNLMLNGIEAMKDSGGKLTIKSQLGNDGQLLISISDTGVGLPVEKADQIFNAFFTTKPQGSGMGLAISRSIVESHGGQLSASANSGGGATFHFTLPSVAEELKVPATGP